MEPKNYTEEQLLEMTRETEAIFVEDLRARRRIKRPTPMAGRLGGDVRLRDGHGVVEVSVCGYLVGWLELHEPQGEEGPAIALRFYPRTDHETTPRAEAEVDW